MSNLVSITCWWDKPNMFGVTVNIPVAKLQELENYNDTTIQAKGTGFSKATILPADTDGIIENLFFRNYKHHSPNGDGDLDDMIVISAALKFKKATL